MKRTKVINKSRFRKGFVLASVVASTFALSGCEVADQTVKMYQTVDECSTIEATEYQSAEQCKASFEAAKAEHEKSAPKFQGYNDCSAEFGNCKLDRLTGFRWANPNMCLAIKLSHRYKKNNPHFRKTMQHIRFLRNKDVRLTEYLMDISKLREKETLSYAHPVLDTTKDKFFKDDIYTYDHDTIHEAVALMDRPAYTFYMKDGSQVMTDKKKFFELPKEIQLAGVYEETCVLALERSQIPNDFKNVSSEHSFMMALEKVCTSITSGWFREYAWENYHTIIAMYKKLGVNDYINRFKENQDLLKPFTRG